MSDFNDGFWSIYVAALTLAGIFGCLLLLWLTARKKVVSRSDNTTGHVWDGDLREMNNP
ncbi:MAG: cbb3-type cytochrome c oxidase N-terminal domain-containing protein, partial [Burkholderiaceae bacterium]|nr:cbb3-type cytochrome c oxidase N-terminal domain-containing protein [Burkholderiaceae bacterium]